MRMAHAVGHHLPCTQGQACQNFIHWLKANAVWEAGQYTDVVIGEVFRPEGYTPVWCHNVQLLCELACCSCLTFVCQTQPSSVYVCVVG